MKTKVLKTINSIFILIMLFSGCTKDGEDGLAYLSLDWDWYVDSYWDNNSDIPYSITRNRDYNVNPGTYNFEYECSDGWGNYWGYEGTYKITINEGGKATLFENGEDGSYRYYSFFLSGNGSNMNVIEKNDILSVNKELLDSIHKNHLPLCATKKIYTGNTYEEIYIYNNLTIHVKKHEFIIE
jgi:hypothetical protein